VWEDWLVVVVGVCADLDSDFECDFGCISLVRWLGVGGQQGAEVVMKELVRRKGCAGCNCSHCKHCKMEHVIKRDGGNRPICTKYQGCFTSFSTVCDDFCNRW